MKKSPLLNTVSAAIKNLRLQKDMSQEKLSKKSGVDRAYISRLEKGTANPSFRQIEKLVKALGAQIKVTITP